MDHRTIKPALLIALAAVSSGCGTSDSEFVDFEQTAKSPLDQQTTTTNTATEEPARTDRATVPAPETLSTPPVAAAADSVHPAVSPADGSSGADGRPEDSTAVQTVSVNTPVPDVVEPSTIANPQQEVSDTVVVSTQSGLTGPADNPLLENAIPSEPRSIELLIPAKTFRKERGSKALRVSYDDIDLLKVLNMEPVPVDAFEHFPDWLKSLDGKPIRIRGWMIPTFQATGLTSFTLARDNGICCFVRLPKIYDVIGVTLADGNTTDYIFGRPFDVEGVFHIEPDADEHDLSRLYRIDNAQVIDSP